MKTIWITGFLTALITVTIVSFLIQPQECKCRSVEIKTNGIIINGKSIDSILLNKQYND